MTRITLAAVAAALTLAAVAADPTPTPDIDTSFLRRFAETRGFMLGRPTKPKFTPDGKRVLFLRAAGPITPKLSLFEFDVATGKTRELLSAEAVLKGAAENLSAEEKARRERQRVTVGGFADYHLGPDGSNVLVTLSGRPYVFDRGTGKVREVAAGPGAVVDPKWSPDGKLVSYVRGYDVYAFDLAADKELALTTGGTAVKTHGLAEFVAQEEMDRHTGYWWSPDSKLVAYEEADHAGVETWHIADPGRPDRPPQPQFYPRPGKKNVTARLGIKSVAGGETVWVEWDRKNYEYLAAVKWDKVGGLTVQVQDRKQQELALLRVDPATGKTSTLLRDRNPASWVNLSQDVPRWYDADRFLWLSDVGGDTRLRLADTRETGPDRVRNVSPTGLQVTGLIELVHASSEEHKTPVVQATVDGTTSYPWLVTTDRASAIQMERKLGPGVCTMATTKDLGTRAVTFTSLGQMPRTWVESETLKGGTKRADLASAAEEPPFTPNVTVQKLGEFWTAVVRPRNFDKAKKYPVLVDVYGGPHHIHVVQAMRNWLIPQWLADRGFVVVAIDNRGTPGRGRDWERAVYQKFGTVPVEDQVKGLQLVGEKFPELDLSRVGVVGWSFGGYMAANAVLRRPDVFHAAVAGAPVTDWEDYDTHYTERYLGLLPESKAAYDEASLLPLAKGLRRPLLLVHGTADDNVYYRHTLKLSDALFRAGREFEALPLPGVTHQYSADPQVAERYWARAVTFFRRHLGGPT